MTILTEKAAKEIIDKISFLISIGASDKIIDKLQSILDNAKIIENEK